MSAAALTPPTPVLPPDLIATCRAILGAHARTFDLAGKLLPRDTLDRAAVVYAFCRLVDDTADEAPDMDTAERGLARLADELEGRVPARPVVRGFRTVCEATGVPIEAARELIRGVRSDLDEVRVADDRGLLRYGYRVAGTVGLMMCGVLGVRDRTALANAIDLGVAMQITNICRDVLEDAGRGRIYLPADRLERAGVRGLLDLPDGPVDRAALSGVIRDLLALADRYYESADAGMAAIPWAGRAAIVVAARVYRAIGVELLRRGADPLRGRTVVGPIRKAWWTARALAWTALRSWRVRRGHDAALHAPLAGLPGTHN